MSERLATLRSGLAGTASVFVATAVIQKAAPFLLMLVLARRIPVATFGQIGVLSSIFILTIAIGGLGLESAAFRGVFTSRTSEDVAEYYANLTKVSFVGPVVIALVASAFLLTTSLPLAGIPPRDVVLVVVGACMFAAATTAPLARLRAEGNVRWYVVCFLVPTVVQVTTKLVLCVGFDLGTEGWAFGDIAAGTTALMLTLPRQVRDLVAWPPSAHVIGGVLRLGTPLLPHVVSSWVLSLSDRLLIAGLVGVTAAGQYGLVAQLASVGTILATELNRALAPEYGRVISGSDGAEARLARIVRVQRLLSVPIFVGTALAALFFVLVLAPDEYHHGVGWALVLCAGLMLYSWYYPPMNCLSIIEGKTVRMPFITASAAVLNVVVNLVLLGEFGPVVAAYSTVLGYALLFLLTSLYAGRRPALHWSVRTMAGCALAFGALLVVGGVMSA